MTGWAPQGSCQPFSGGLGLGSPIHLQPSPLWRRLEACGLSGLGLPCERVGPWTAVETKSPASGSPRKHPLRALPLQSLGGSLPWGGDGVGAFGGVWGGGKPASTAGQKDDARVPMRKQRYSLPCPSCPGL